MFLNAGLVGLAIVLTLLAGLGLSYFEEYAVDRGLLPRPFSRPGAIALLFGVGLTALIVGQARGNGFIVAAGVFACISGLPWLRQGGQFTSFLLLWLGAAGVVAVLGAEIPAFGVRAGDVVFTAFLLAAFCSLLREWDAAGSYGWFAALLTAGGVTVLCYELDRTADTRLGVLLTGAVFGVIAAAPFGSGLLSRIGSRFVGLLIGGMAVRAAVGSPNAMIGVAAAGGIAVVIWALSLRRPYRLRVVLGGLALAAVLGAMSVPALQTVREIYEPMKRTVTASRGLVKTEPKVGLVNAAAQLKPIEANFRRYAKRLDRPQVQVARFVPFVGANLRATTATARAAADLSSAARSLLGQVNVRQISPKRGVVDHDQLGRLNDGLKAVQFVITRSQKNLVGGDELLVPELREDIERLLFEIQGVENRVDTTMRGTAAAERLLGFGRPRTFFIAVQNTAEARATGGYIANYGIVTMNNGRVSTRHFARTSIFDEAKDRPRVLRAPLDFRRRYSQFDVNRNWSNVNLSPDFPTVAKVMADQYKQYSGESLDGVIAVDPIGMAKLMQLTGPLTVTPWPVPLTAKNAAKILLHDEYVAFDGKLDQRIDFLGRVANQVFDVLVARGLDDLFAAGPVIHELTATRQLQFWSPDVLTQAFFRETSADGWLPPVVGDSLMVTTQNAAGNKADYFFKRSFRYEATVKKAGDGVAVKSTLRVTLQNDAPATGEPKYVIGPHDSRFAPGQNRVFFTVYSPFDLESATIDGKKLSLLSQPELGRTAYSAFVDIPARSRRVIELHLSGETRHTRRYVLDLIRQPLVFGEPFDLVLHGVGPRGEIVTSGTLTRSLRVDTRTR